MARPLKNLSQIAVIGGGIAGLAAARQATRLGRLVTLFEPTGMYGGQVATVERVDGFGAPGHFSGQDIAIGLLEDARKAGARIVEVPVLSVDVGQRLTLTDGEGGVHHPETIVVASGGAARRLGVPGEDAFAGRGLSHCATCDGGFFRGQDVAVVGGGDAAVTEALVLARSSRTVFIVSRSPLKAKREYIERIDARENVRFVWDSEVTAIVGNDGGVAGLTLRDVRDGATSEIACAGVFPYIAHFLAQEWSDGLPIVPPTIDKVEAFLAFTDRKPTDVLGIVLPESRAVTVWATAVNGVMAGCRPEYMPILVALGEAMCDPIYGVEHSGNTPGSETLIVLNGPIIKQLGFNYEQGVLRDGFQPNTSVGRFWRLALRNMAGFRLHRTDKGSFGNTFRVVLAENEDALAGIGWPSNAADMGFATGDDCVTITRLTGGGVFPSVTGSTPEQMMPYICDQVAAQTGWEIVFTVGGLSHGTLRPVLILTPILAETIAKAGWSKRDVKQWLYDHARMTARRVEAFCNDYADFPIGSLKHQVNLGRLPRAFAESDDPDRLVPIVVDPEDFMVLVSGDPLRTNAYTFTHNGYLGFPVARRIALPAGWGERFG